MDGHRGRVPPEIMDEIGYENCDYISHERHFNVWKQHVTTGDSNPRYKGGYARANNIGPLELHVPCRDPIDHILSQCNHRGRKFNCTSVSSAVKRQNNATGGGGGDAVVGAIQREVLKCLVDFARFSPKLLRLPNTTVKCFDPIPADRYVDYMSSRLQRKRVENDYIQRDSNRSRNKTRECLHPTSPQYDASITDLVRRTVIQHNSYYGFCDQCKGTKNDLYYDADDPPQDQHP